MAKCPICKRTMTNANLKKYGRCFSCYMEEITGADCKKEPNYKNQKVYIVY